jgi:hypothetical protein
MSDLNLNLVKGTLLLVHQETCTIPQCLLALSSETWRDVKAVIHTMLLQWNLGHKHWLLLLCSLWMFS